MTQVNEKINNDVNGWMHDKMVRSSEVMRYLFKSALIAYVVLIIICSIVLFRLTVGRQLSRTLLLLLRMQLHGKRIIHVLRLQLDI